MIYDLLVLNMFTRISLPMGRSFLALDEALSKALGTKPHPFLFICLFKKGTVGWGGYDDFVEYLNR